MPGDCGARVAGNQFGAGVVRQHGARCAATLAVPKVPRFAGRGGIDDDHDAARHDARASTTTTPADAGLDDAGSAPGPGGGSGGRPAGSR